MTISENITNNEKTLKLTEIGVKELLDAGIHFGHEKTKWNPKMRTYIHSSRKGIHIIDITQTLTILNTVCKYVKNLSKLLNTDLSFDGQIFKLDGKNVKQSEIENMLLVDCKG